MNKNLKCPVCGKGLTEQEFDKALSLWKSKTRTHKTLRRRKGRSLKNKNRLIKNVKRNSKLNKRKTPKKKISRH